jgi:hypothetical protein
MEEHVDLGLSLPKQTYAFLQEAAAKRHKDIESYVAALLNNYASRTAAPREPDQPAHSEKRRHKRSAVSLKATLVPKDKSAGTLKGLVKDVSFTGVCLLMSEHAAADHPAIASGSMLKVKFTVAADNQVSLDCRIMRRQQSDEGLELGCEIEDIDYYEYMELIKLLK